MFFFVVNSSVDRALLKQSALRSTDVILFIVNEKKEEEEKNRSKFADFSACQMYLLAPFRFSLMKAVSI